MRTRTKSILIRLTPGELESIDRKAEAAKLPREKFCRMVLSGVQIKEAPPAEFFKLITEVRRVGVHLNQILKNDEALFIVVGDLNLKGRYAESMMAFTTDKIIAFDECYDNGSFSVDYADIEEAQVKRLYGNAVFKIKFKNGINNF